MGFEDRGWILPELIEVDHEIQSPALDGMLFRFLLKALRSNERSAGRPFSNGAPRPREYWPRPIAGFHGAI
jgi:hypothetical protein